MGVDAKNLKPEIFISYEFSCWGLDSVLYFPYPSCCVLFFLSNLSEFDVYHGKIGNSISERPSPASPIDTKAQGSTP